MEVTRESEGPARRLRGHVSPKKLAGNIEVLAYGAEQSEAGNTWKFRGQPKTVRKGEIVGGPRRMTLLSEVLRRLTRN